MKQTDPQLKIRLPPDLKTKVEAAAARNNRSMNAEIVARLEASFGEAFLTLSPSDVERTSRVLAESVIEKINEMLCSKGG